jgi:drug/metabolite transporter (DMT)-like permease
MLAGVVAVSSGSLFVRLADAPALAVACARMSLAALLLAPFAVRPLARALPGLSTRGRLALVASGIALAVHFGTWIASLSYTSVAASVLLVNTAPLFSLGLSRVLLGEGVPRIVLWATLLALLGAVLIGWGDWTSGVSLWGNALALAGAVALSLYHVIGRGLRLTLPLAAYVLAVWSVAALALLAVVGALGVPLVDHPPRTLLMFLALATIPTLLGHGLVNLSLRALPAPTVGLFLLGEPVGAALLARLFLDETPAPLTLAGGAVVLAGLGLVLARPGR